MPTRLPRADMVIRGLACSSPRRRTLVSSRSAIGSVKADAGICRGFAGNLIRIPSDGYSLLGLILQDSLIVGSATDGTVAASERSLRLARAGRAVTGLPPASYFLTSAVFHYLGPSFAVLLFAHVSVLGVAWLRIAAAAAVFAIWRRPWRMLIAGDRRTRLLVAALGVNLAVMNCIFYLAIDRMPLATVAATEFAAAILI